MKDKANLINILAPIVLLFIAAWLDRLLNALKDYAGRSFDFQGALWGQFALTLFFVLLLVAFARIYFMHYRPGRQFYFFYIGLALFLYLHVIFTFLIPIDALFRIPYGIRRVLQFAPISFMGLSVAFILWMGISGLFLQKKR